ncbi:MAG: hypothetical protein ACO2ZP_07355 [Bacteriovoracaceae bacterium]
MKLYKIRKPFKEPITFPSTCKPPRWHGQKGDYVFGTLDDEYVENLDKDKVDIELASVEDEDWVLQNSDEMNREKNHLRDRIRKKFSIEDELKALRTNDQEVLNAIAEIVKESKDRRNSWVGRAEPRA